MINETNLEIFKKTLPFWDKLSQDEIELLVTNTNIIKYKKGKHIQNSSSMCVGVLIIKTGELRTYILSQNGKEITLYRLKEFDVCILSVSCLFKNITFDVFIDAIEDCQVFLINTEIFSKVMSQNVYVEIFSLKSALDKFSDVMWAMEQILFMSFDSRLAVFLLDEIKKTGKNNLNITHEQIAKYVSSAREVVSRMLKYFAKEGIVALYRGGIEILDKQKLENLI